MATPTKSDRLALFLIASTKKLVTSSNHPNPIHLETELKRWPREIELNHVTPTGFGFENSPQFAPLTNLDRDNLAIRISATGGAPTTATFTLSYDGEKTGELDLQADWNFQDLSEALNALASVKAAGGLEVVRASSADLYNLTTPEFRVTWDYIGEREPIELTVINSNLPSSAKYTAVISGSDTHKEYGSIKIRTTPLYEIAGDDWSEVSTAPAVIVTQVSAPSALNDWTAIDRVSIDREPAGGLLRVSMNGLSSPEWFDVVLANRQPEVFAAHLRDIGALDRAERVNVRKVGWYEWEITTELSEYSSAPTYSVDGTRLVAREYLEADFDFETAVAPGLGLLGLSLGRGQLVFQIVDVTPGKPERMLFSQPI